MENFSIPDLHRDRHDFLADYMSRNKKHNKKNNRRNLIASNDPKDPHYRPTEDKVAFVFVAMGMAVNMPDLGYAVRTLRDVGGYKGDIYILSDICIKRKI